MNITIDKSLKEPAYEQIKRQIGDLVRDGLLEAGEKIPSVRELARSLGVSVKTVYSAYEALAAENIIATRHGIWNVHHGATRGGDGGEPAHARRNGRAVKRTAADELGAVLFQK